MYISLFSNRFCFLPTKSNLNIGTQQVFSNQPKKSKAIYSVLPIIVHNVFFPFIKCLVIALICSNMTQCCSSFIETIEQNCATEFYLNHHNYISTSGPNSVQVSITLPKHCRKPSTNIKF